MERLFLTVLEISVMVNFLILAVLLIRGCFKKASASFRCVLWILVGVRLLLPVNINSPFGLVPDVDFTAVESVQGEIAGDADDASRNPIVGNQQSSQEMSGQVGDNTNPSGTVVPGTAIQGTVGANPDYVYGGGQGVGKAPYYGSEAEGMYRENVQDTSGGEKPDTNTPKLQDTGKAWLVPTMVVWIGGVCLMLTYMIFSWLRLHKRLRTAVPETIILGDRQVRIYRVEGLESPFLLGIRPPKIYLPYTVREQDVEYVLEHELMHIRRKDHLLKPISFLVLALYWFHPLVWVAYILLGRDIELACDEQVLRENESLDRAGYAEALLSCGNGRRGISVCPVAFGESDVKRRVKNVLDYKKPGFWVVLVCVLLCVIVALCFMTVSEDEGAGDAVTTGGEVTQEDNNGSGAAATTEPATAPTAEPSAEPTQAPTTKPSAEPMVTPTAAPTATSEPIATPVPTMVPENYVPGAIAGYTEGQSKQIREELARRIVYELEESFNMVFVSLDDTDVEKGTGLGTIFLPEDAQLHSLDVVNRMEAVKMDGNEWLAVTVVPNISMGDTTFPAKDRSFEILVDVDRKNDGSIVFGTIYATYNMADEDTGSYYEENNYTRMQIHLLKADVTHDGIEDYIETYMYMPPETDMTVEIDELIQSIMFHDSVFVSVYDGSVAAESDYDAPIMTHSYSRVHAGNGQINIVYEDGAAYLMSTSLWSGQGFQTYSYEVFALDAKGRCYVKERYGDSFNVDDYTLEQRNGFANKFTDAMAPWLEEGILIVGADIDKGQLISTERREYASWEFYDWFFKGKFPNAGSAPEPTIVPEDDVPGPIEGYTEDQSKQIRDELAGRIKYEIDDKTSMTIWLDSEEYEPENYLGTVRMHVNSGMEFQSLDIVNHIEALEMDGQKWLAVRLVPDVIKGDVAFPNGDAAMEIMIPVSIRADGTIALGEYYPKEYYTQLENSIYVHDAYEEEKYIRIRLNLMQADVTHDGIPDNIETLMYLPPETDMTQDIDTLVEWQISVDNVLIQVYDGSTATEDSLGTPIFCSGYSTAHAGNGQLSVVHRDGKDYLLEGTLWQGQGSTSYHFDVLALDGAGHQYIIDHAEFNWDSRNEEDTWERLEQAIASFREELAPWIEEGRIVVVTDGGLYPGKEYMITTEKRQYAPQEFYDQMLKGVR